MPSRGRSRRHRVTAVFVAPGNAGTALEPRVHERRHRRGRCRCTGAIGDAASASTSPSSGPEAPLVIGVIDAFQAAGLRCFGPRQLAARLEGSKAFTKEFLQSHRIPTAAYAPSRKQTSTLTGCARSVRRWSSKRTGSPPARASSSARRLRSHSQRAGDVRRPVRRAPATRSSSRNFSKARKRASSRSSSGEHILPLATSQDHKRRDDGDHGPNTGGMGAYSPAPVVTPAIHHAIMREVMEPTVRGLAADGTPYVGFLYAGLMIAADGTPNVLEFNCRFGDPETQPIMMRLNSDLDSAVRSGARRATRSRRRRPGTRARRSASCWPRAVTPIRCARAMRFADSMPQPASGQGVSCRHAAASMIGSSRTAAVFCALSASARPSSEAQRAAYALCDTIDWDGVQYRRDIGYRAIARELHLDP